MERSKNSKKLMKYSRIDSLITMSHGSLVTTIPFDPILLHVTLFCFEHFPNQINIISNSVMQNHVIKPILLHSSIIIP